ncbi:S8 family serine peptidase [Chryseobacterium sp. Bi04]|uniref:S8 family serine peptidase n=1 Tax=Chryseobacterium sp. Bi04 TaxID=2822345 RepID=UPI001DDBAB43|nr:S8 family serine peptidase [Chryseobacterium sp. Bi04]CAH0194111.1 Extracellular serine protease [Chryseobacterium sp. Bi04]
MKKKFLFSASFCFYASVHIFGQTERERSEIVKNYDQIKLLKLFETFHEKEKTDKAEAIVYAKKNNIPLIIKTRKGSLRELIRIENGKPVYYTTDNINAAKSTRTNFLNSGGALDLNLNGEDMVIGVWDGGAARATHIEFDNRVTIKDNATFNNISNSDHSTHVVGTIGAAGVISKAKGMAPKSQIDDYDWNSDKSEVIAAVSRGLLLSNHSYSLLSDTLDDSLFGAYTEDSKNWDDILFNATSYLAVHSAGNDGTNYYNTIGNAKKIINASPMGGPTDLFDKLTGAGTSKNALIVANAQSVLVDRCGNFISASINDTSSQGPTDDLRIKPDITGYGTNIYSSVAFSGSLSSNTNYDSKTGTSMASPNVTGTLALIQQHHKNVQQRYMLGAEIKGLALHTADDAGIQGPDSMFGWGLLNAKKMVETINEKGKASLIENKTLRNNAKETFTINYDGVKNLTVSISWYDKGGVIQARNELNNNTTKRLVNNLDLKVTRENDNTVYQPWVLTSRSTNTRAENDNDNFERVDLGIVPAGKYTIEISHKGILDGGLQNYTLIVTGIATESIGDTLIATSQPCTNKDNSKAIIYPNPVDTEINLLNVEDGTLYVIYDLSGRAILQSTLKEAKINVSSLISGRYILVLDENSYKFIKK